MGQHLDFRLVIVTLHELILADHFGRLCLIVSVVSGGWQATEISFCCISAAEELRICALFATNLADSRPGGSPNDVACTLPVAHIHCHATNELMIATNKCNLTVTNLCSTLADELRHESLPATSINCIYSRGMLDMILLHWKTCA